MVYTTTQYLDFVKILFTIKMSQHASKCNFIYTHEKGMAFPGPQMFEIIVYTKLHPNQMINMENMHRNHLCPHETHNNSTNFCEHLLC